MPRQRRSDRGYQPRLIPDVTALVAYGMPLLDMAAVLAAAFFMTWFLPFIHDLPSIWPWPDLYRGAVILACLFSPLVLHRFRLYRSWRGYDLANELFRLFGAWLVVIFLMSLVGVVTKSNFMISRVWFFSTMCTAGLVWAVYRTMLRQWLSALRAHGGNQKRVYLVGWGEALQHVIDTLESKPSAGFQVAGVFVDSPDRSRPKVSARFLGDLEALSQRVAYPYTRPDQVWVVLPMEDSNSIRDIYARLLPTLVDVRYVPDMAGFALMNARTTQVAGLPLVHLTESPMAGVNRFIKAVEDRVLASVFLLVSLPVMLVVAVLVKATSRGPVIFKQMRHGWNGEAIAVWKFRTMYLHRKARVYEQARRHDPRITPVGRFLRRTSLDELPQFFNVLQGNMSVVGPRPHPVQMNTEYRGALGDYMLRHRVKPGITGWAQVNGYRGETPTMDLMEKRIQHDLYYIEHWSVWFDLFIVVLTVFRGVFSKRAY